MSDHEHPLPKHAATPVPPEMQNEPEPSIPGSVAYQQVSYASPTSPRPRRRRTALVVGSLAVLMVVAAGAGTAMYAKHRSAVEAEAKREAAIAVANAAAKSAKEAEEKAKAEQEARKAAARARQQASFDACTGQLHPLMNALSVVDARLDVGLSQSEFADYVGKASVAYSRIDIDALGKGACLSAGAKLEAALNSYIKVNSAWNDCIYDYYCDVDSIDPMMQEGWSAASRSIKRAKNDVASLDPDNATSGSSNSA